MASKLALYNRALRRIGERRLASLTEDRPIRHELDEVWSDGFVNEVLEAGNWNFAIRTVEQTYETDIATDFGYRRAFAKPADWVRTVGFCSDEHFTAPINAMVDESGYWSCDLDTIYVRYVSNDGEFGGDLGSWTASFTHWAGIRLAAYICPNTARGGALLDEIKKEDRRLLMDALAKDGVGEGAKFAPIGTWLAARSRGARRARENA